MKRFFVSLAQIIALAFMAGGSVMIFQILGGDIPEVHKSVSQDGRCKKVFLKGDQIPDGCEKIKTGTISKYQVVWVK